MARAFVLAHPARSPLLACYGDEFPDFIGDFARPREAAYLADVMRIEAARTRAYHAVDAAPVGADAFAALTVEAASTMRPVGRDHSLPHPIVTIWAMNSGERGLAPIEDWRREDALVARPLLEVGVRVLPPGVSEFLLALAAGRPLGEAALHALAACPQFNLTNNVAGLIGCASRAVSLPQPRMGGSHDERHAADWSAGRVQPGGHHSTDDGRTRSHTLWPDRARGARLPGRRVLAIRSD
jgi:hypothetical protein